MEFAFENYLSLVAQLYYKANFQPSTLTQIPESNGVFTSNEEQNPLLAIKKPGKRGRKAKPKPQAQQAREIADDSTEMSLESLNMVENEQKEDPGKDEVKVLVDAPALAKVDIMDSLVSPLKADYVFGK